MDRASNTKNVGLSGLTIAVSNSSLLASRCQQIPGRTVAEPALVPAVPTVVYRALSRLEDAPCDPRYTADDVPVHEDDIEVLPRGSALSPGASECGLRQKTQGWSKIRTC
ncbi:hypothetical protein WA026_020379 [Henosepilachna vigintioctopunctata]|uniref:Uncharacterized protein n=1 Tax=Henosepilachna vigintioctopunctata TaxID=420089 RepID=A0AAW1UP23_9CUCU